MTPDFINGLFEVLACLFILNNCMRLYRDKTVKGVSIASTAFFFAWGIWNLHFYPAVGQNFSFVAGIAVCLANGLWVAMMVFYHRKEQAQIRMIKRKIFDMYLTHTDGCVPNIEIERESAK